MVMSGGLDGVNYLYRKYDGTIEEINAIDYSSDSKQYNIENFTLGSYASWFSLFFETTKYPENADILGNQTDPALLSTQTANFGFILVHCYENPEIDQIVDFDSYIDIRYTSSKSDVLYLSFKDFDF